MTSTNIQVFVQISPSMHLNVFTQKQYIFTRSFPFSVSVSYTHVPTHTHTKEMLNLLVLLGEP